MGNASRAFEALLARWRTVPLQNSTSPLLSRKRTCGAVGVDGRVCPNPDRRRSNQRCASGEQVEIDRVWRLRSKYVMPPPSYRHSTLVQPRNGYEKGDISSAVRPCGSQCCQPLQIRSPAVCARTLRSAKSTPGIARLDIRTTPLTITVSTSSPTPHSTRLLMGSCTGP